MKVFGSAALVLILLFVPFCVSAGEDGGLPQSWESIPSLRYNDSMVDQALLSPVAGTPRAAGGGDSLATLVIQVNEPYFYEGKRITCTYELLIANVSNASVGATVSAGQEVGKVTKDSLVTARCSRVDPFMLRMTNMVPVLHEGYYYFSPAWLMPSGTRFLSFRQVESLEDAVLDFYHRWEIEGEDASGSDGTIHFFPELDRIRVRVRLDEYPQAALRSPAVGLTERTYFGSTVFPFENALASSCAYQPVLYWQKGFDQYLSDEYRLGDDLFLYANIFTLDHKNKRIIICVVDFALRSDEDVVRQRFADLNL